MRWHTLMTMTEHAAITFPDGFLWGAATAAYQIEGAAHDGGRGLSVWDTFSHTEGKVANRHTGDIACDHYHRVEQDVAMMAQLGLQSYRFSIAWSRVMPDGRGHVNAEGLAFYERLVDGLLERGIEPCPTLYHWDLPQALEDRWGGWRSRDTAKAMGEFAQAVARRLGSRVKKWMTINEGANAADVSNLIGAGNPNAAATPYILPEIAGNPGIFLPPADLPRLEMLRDFDAKTRRLLSRMWTEIKVR